MKNLFRIFSLAVYCSLFLVGSQAKAQVKVEMPVVNEETDLIVSFEGPITDLNVTEQCIQVMTANVFIPDTLLLDGTAGITGATIARLSDESAGDTASRSLFAGIDSTATPYSGGTFKGLAVQREGKLVAFELVIELAENVISGVIENVDLTTQSFTLNGIKCRMNTDNRFPADLVDAGLEPITLADLVPNQGVGVITAIGYYVNGCLETIAVEAEGVLPPPPAPEVDVVRITRVRARNRRGTGELRVDVLTTFEAGKTISLFDDQGVLLDVVDVTQELTTAEGAANFRVRDLARIPATITAVSSGGGEHTVAVEVR